MSAAQGRDDLVKRAKKVLVELEEMVEEVEASHAEHPEFWSKYDRNRAVLELKTAAHCMTDAVDKIGKVGTWKPPIQ